MKSSLKNARGYSLMELIIYMFILSLFLLLAGQLFISVKDSSLQSRVYADLAQGSHLIFSDLVRNIQESGNVLSPLSGSTSDTLSLNDGGITYQLSENNLVKTVSGTPLFLNNSNLSVTSLSFQNLSLATQSASIRINLTLRADYLLPGDRFVSEQLQTTATAKTP